ncbi:unnamed protein product [Paramecium sonneborni]|uniref:Uncharacterized protein n=1 Tax=Paramecium sonneborni TaxID=65129 RepID=A0A8S1RKQ5_9CILI|nr:unnamed protein product [Paramecium sonneborni]
MSQRLVLQLQFIYINCPSGIWIDINELANFRNTKQQKVPKLNNDIFQLKIYLGMLWYYDFRGTYNSHQMKDKVPFSMVQHNIFQNQWNGFFELIELKKILIRNIKQDTQFQIINIQHLEVEDFHPFGLEIMLQLGYGFVHEFINFLISIFLEQYLWIQLRSTPQLLLSILLQEIILLDQEPYLHEITKISAQNSINLRYEFLKYYYFLFISQRDSTLQTGSNDPQTFNIEIQFQIGNIIVNPVVEEQNDSNLDYTEMQFYVPQKTYWVSLENVQQFQKDGIQLKELLLIMHFQHLKQGLSFNTIIQQES